MDRDDETGGNVPRTASPAEAAPRPGWFIPLAAGAAALALQAAIYDRWFGLLDEGYILAIADDVNRGKVLYRDVYIDAPFPGAFHLLAAWFRLVGTSIWASRLLVVAAFTVLVVCATRVATAVLPRRGVVALAVALVCYRVWAFPHWQVYNYSPMAAAALTAAVAVLLGWLEHPRAIRLVAAGLLAGIGILCKQDYGLAVTGALGLFLLLRPLLDRRPSLAPATQFTLGLGLVVGPAMAALAYAGALPGLVQQAILVPLSGAINFTYTRLPALRPLLHQDAGFRAQVGSYLPAILLTLRWERIAAGWAWRETPLWELALKAVYWAPVATFAVAAPWWLGTALARARRRTAGPGDARRLLLLAWQGGFLLAFNRPRDWVHLMMIYPPVLVTGGVLAAQVGRWLPRRLRRVASLGGVLALLALVAWSGDLARELRRTLTWPIASPRAGVRVDTQNGPVVDDVLAWIAANAPAGEPVPVYPIQPMISFLAGRPTPADFHVIWPVQGGDRDARIIAALERERPAVAIYSLSQYAHLGRFRDNAPALWAYLVAHYDLAHTFAREPWGPLLVGLVRRPDEASPGTSLLATLGAQTGLARAQWPFAEVLVAPIGSPAAQRTATARVGVPSGWPLLVVRYGVNPERWLGLADGPFTFTVAVDGTPVFSETLDPGRRLEDRRWAEARVPLDRWANRDVALTFGVSTPREPRDGADLAGWADVRLLSPPDAADPPARAR